MIAVFRTEGQSLRAIARTLGRDPGTISRELKRNAPPIKTGYYLPHRAQQRAELRWQESHIRPRLKDDSLRQYVRDKLKEGWSPEQISGRREKGKMTPAISPETIYQWIYTDARELIPLLPRHHRKRWCKGHHRRHKKLHIPERISIKDRPQSINNRQEPGHWEIDTIGNHQSLVTLVAAVERKTRYTRIHRIPQKTARNLSNSLKLTLGPYPQELRLSLTYDNGPENTDHLITNSSLGTQSFFCEPFHSWEKGSIENLIGLVRRYFPKKTNFSHVSPEDVKQVEIYLNNRPRKCLKYLTPAEAFQAASVALAH